LQFSTDTIERAAHVPSLGVSPTPTPESAVAWIPTVATTAFPQALATDEFPGLPELMSNGIVHPADFVRFEAFLLPRVRSR
jgi:hypothetical protein